MNLSEAIERCLLDGHYDIENAYMCNALYRLGAEVVDEHVESVRALVDSIRENEYTLWGALYDSGYIDGLTEAEAFQYTTQLYVWWVFDLKRKGL